jgi:NADH-ubiquinone oxidoreductase chain 5
MEKGNAKRDNLNTKTKLMYLSIIFLPLLSSIVSGLFGRKVGVTGSQIITCTSLIVSSFLITVAFYEVGICASPVSIDIISWLDIEILSISWSFYFDQLTVSLCLAVLYCSTLIHIYSVDYLSTDPHNQRFFSYLSAFTAGMLILICGGNLFVMFVGLISRPKCSVNYKKYTIVCWNLLKL